MARTVTEIQEQMNADLKANRPDLYSISKTAVYKLITYIVASAIHLFETILDNFKSDINKSLENNRYGRLEWYVDIVKSFQVDDDLLCDNGVIRYAEIKEDKKIIQKVAVIDRGAGLKVKVAKLEGDKLVQLSQAEQLQLENYMDKTKVAGTELEVVNLQADTIEYAVNVYYDPIYKEEDVKTNVLLTLDNFRDNTGFDSMFRHNEFLNSIRNTTGVVDAQVMVLRGRQGSNLEQIQLVYDVQAGYYNWHDDSVLTMYNSNIL